MATIVQPYNPWREQLALTALGNVAGNIIGDIWKTHKQNEQNRKANAFRAQLQQNLGNIAQNAEISLTPREAPQGYNSNPWASAFHQNDSPLTAFDIGTAGIGKTPGIQDIVQSADSLAASKRFSMLSPEIVQGVKNSMIQQAENQRLRDLQNNFADMFGSADDIQGQMKALIMGATHGVVAPQVLTAFTPYARDVLSPYTFTESDLGQNKVISALNRITGMATPGMIMPVSVSPNTTANNETQRYVANRGAQAQEYGYDSTSQWRNRELEDEERQREYERKNPQQITIQDREGNYYGYNSRTNTATPITDAEGYFIAGDTGKSPALTAALKAIDTEMKSLDDRAKSIRQMYIGADDTELVEMNKELAPILARQQELAKDRKAYVQQLFPQETQRRKPAQTVQAPQTPGGFMANANVQSATHSADQIPITAMGASSTDVRPQEPVNTKQNFSDFRPSYIGELQPITTVNTATPKVQLQQSAQPPIKKAQPRQIQRNMRDFTVSDDMAYDPARDKDIPPTKIYTPEHFKKFIKSLQDNPEFARYSTEQLLDWAYQIGIRIRQ